MFLLRSMSEHEENWKQAGVKNRLALIALLDEFIQRDEAFRKIKSRNYAIDKRQELDRMLIEERTKRIEKEKSEHAINQSIRIMELEKRKRESIKAANKRFQKMENDAKQRDAFHKKRLQAINKDSHKKHEREKTMLNEKSRLIEAEKAKAKNARDVNKLQESKGRAEIELLRQRIMEIEHQKAKARAETKQKIQFVEKMQRQKTEYHLKRLRDLERNHERDTLSLVSRINELEMEKERQKNILRKRNERFKTELENREKITSAQIENDEKQKQKYFSKLNTRITKLGNQRDSLIYNSRENLSVFREKSKKENSNISQSGDIFEKPREWIAAKTLKEIDKISKEKEREATYVIDALKNDKEVKSESNKKGKKIRKLGATKVELDNKQNERREKWELEAKEREKQKIKKEFRKLMANFRQ